MFRFERVRQLKTNGIMEADPFQTGNNFPLSGGSWPKIATYAIICVFFYVCK